MTNENFDINFIKSGRGKAQFASNPKYPDGINIDIAGSKKGCLVKLDYPAPECGTWIIKCNKCLLTIGLTAAGRIDDPVSVIIPCKNISSDKN